MYTHAAPLIPRWVHEFRQWHVDMLAILTESQQARVHLGGNWIVFPYAEFERLDPHFLVPLEPVFVPLPPHLRDVIGQISSTIVDRTLDSTGHQESITDPSTSARQTRSRTRALSTGKFLIFLNCYCLIDH